MRSNYLKSLKTAVLAVTILLLGVGGAVAQQTINLTAQPTTVTTPDGSVIPMWGYFCGAAVTGSTASCAALNPAANATTTTAATWSPVVITVPAGQALTINLTNSLSFTAGTGTNTVPTSLVIVGQIGGGLGTSRTTTPAPDHTNAQPLTWPIAGDAPGAGLTGVGTPPAQFDRVQSMATEVGPGATVALTWGATGTPALRPGTYLIESGTHPSIQGPMGLYGILVVTTAPSGTTAGTAYPGVTYNSEVPLLLSEIDPVQNKSVNAAVTTVGFSETAVWSGLPGGCGNPASANYHTCYPPAVNYTPLYYLINGVGFSKTNPTGSQFPAVANLGSTPTITTGITGNVLVRLVNAGLRMHVPSIVGSLTTPTVNSGGAAGTAVAGLSLVAEDGNPVPGVTRVQSEVFMPAGKTFDVMINVPAAGPSLPIYDRELSLSGNATSRDAGMVAYIGVNNSVVPAAVEFGGAVANADTYNQVVTGKTLIVSDPSKGVIANDVNVYGVTLVGTVAGLTLNQDGTFTYLGAPTTFTYCANGSVTGTTCSSGITATVTLGAAPMEAGSGITVNPDSYTSHVATSISIAPPGVLANDKDGANYPLTVDTTTVPTTLGGGTLQVDASGGFTVTGVSTPGTYTFTYKAKNSQGTQSSASATVTVVFPTPSNLAVTVVDGADKTTAITDYRWIIEEDRTFYIDPACSQNPPPAGCPTATIAGLGTTGIVPTFGTNFHTSYMPVVAAGCWGGPGTTSTTTLIACENGQTVFDNNPTSPTFGTHINAVCDLGNGTCRPGTQQTPMDPGQVSLDPTKHYYISVLPGDAGNPFETGNAVGGHGMGGAPIIPTCPTPTTCTFSPVKILVQPTPFPPSRLSVFVFEDDFPLNGEQDGGGGIDVLSPNEPGLGNFNITLFDDAGGTGDATGQMTYDMFNQPLSNSLAGTVDPVTGKDACPVTATPFNGVNTGTGNFDVNPTATPDSPTGITGTIVVCPKYESDGKTLSPLAGQAVVANLMPGRYGVVATPGADRIARGEEWLQTNTLDGQKAHDSFLRIGEPSFFQEYGPAGFHVSIGFANPQIINDRLKFVCNGTDPNITGTGCTNIVTGRATTERMSRTPDERLYSSGDNSSFGFTQCYVSLGDADGEDFAFTKCDANGQFTLAGLPNGDWRITIFDQWNDMLVDGLSTPIRLAGGTTNMGDIAMNQWQANIYTSTFFDANGNGVFDSNETGLTLVATNIRFRDGSYSNFNNTDLSGNAGFNEVFPLFSWYVVETDTTRYKPTGIHVVYDAGGPADDGPGCGGTGNPPCAPSPHSISSHMANSAEVLPVPAALRVPGAYYCASADCAGAPTPYPAGGLNSTTAAGGPGGSTGRVDPPWTLTEGWQGFSGQNSFLEFGKMPFATDENGGIHGEVIYASTRPFDDPTLLIHTSWTPDVPGVTINLYQVGTAADGSQSLKLVDTTKTSSFDDFAQGFRHNANGTLATTGSGTTLAGIPNMNCPGQGRDSGTNADLFFFSIYNQPFWLDLYNNQLHPGGSGSATALPNNAQFKCYDGMHNWNQMQPVPYDGMYQFPSVVNRNPATGRPINMGATNPAGTGTPGSMAGTNCTICTANPHDGLPMLPQGQYVVEMIVPPGYELVKEEDKNILIGDNYIAPVTQQFGGLGAVYIMPDQAEVASLYNANNAQNPTQTFGRTTLPNGEGDTGSVEIFWPCVGASRVVPDYISLFPQSAEVSPFAGATRNLCDRKLVTLDNQASVLAKFWIFSSTHVAAHFTGVITDDFTSEFDPFSPQFGEKFSPADLPVSIKDWTGTEISRVYADHWGTYDGLTYSTWEVNPPNPTGYAPTMMVTCMNDPGTGATPDPLFNPEYSQFCYEIPFMPGQTQYMDTPVVPVSAFAGAGYNNPDCSYPDGTPAIKEVDGTGVGPWVNAAGGTLTITALGPQLVQNNAYSGPSATAPPYNQKTITKNYHFGAAAGTVQLVPAQGGTPLTLTAGWGDTTITATVPAASSLSSAFNCPIQQQQQYGGPNASSPAKCGELVITTAPSTTFPHGQVSVDTVTVTVGGKAPTHVLASASIQDAIDKANPGDMLMIDPTCTTGSGATLTTVACTTAGATHTNSNHTELLIMWKPVRLQGVGAASTILNANTHPAGVTKLQNWRNRIVCLFGMGPSGTPSDWSSGCTASWAGHVGFNATPTNPQVDRLPLEATIGWDASLNGNLAEQLQEPSLMGALEGAAITVLSKGVNFHGANPFDPTLLAGFPTQTTLLTNSTNSSNCGPNGASVTNPFPSSFWCNPSAIDGLGITDSSQGGGGIFVHGWGHNLQIANNRVQNNSGTLGGGINVGQGEFPGAYLQGSATNAPPGSCQTSPVTNAQLPYCHNLNVNVHHNSVSLNSSTGDELFSATPAGAGGVNFCTGSDFYKFNFNWVCGNLSTGDGGGFGHLGFSYGGDIEHNTFVFNQSTNPTIPANGGAMVLMGAPDVDPTCGAITDADCVPTPGSVGPSDGTGPSLTVNANLIMGNQAESGTGGGIALQHINGSEVVAFPNLPTPRTTGPQASRSPGWNSVNLTNNVIVNNVSGWDGAGVSLIDALNVNFINNTVMSNDSTASSGVLFNTLGAPLSSTPPPISGGPTCTSNCGTTSAPQVAGMVSLPNSAVLQANLTGSITCPPGHVGTGPNASCRLFSIPQLYNDVFFQNRTYYIGVGPLGTGTLNQQSVVSLYNSFTSTLAPSQASTGACTAASYWDIGVRGDTGPTNHASGLTLSPEASVLTNITGYTGGGAGFRANSASNPAVVSQYCNGSRIPPEFGGTGWQVPPGISDATVPNPVFALTPAATVDEGNNWINISWGPLSLVNPVTNVILGNYAPAAGSPVINYITNANSATTYAAAPATDFFGANRKTNNAVDAGAIEFVAGAGTPAILAVTPTSLTFTGVVQGTTSAVQNLTLSNTGGAGATGIAVVVTSPFARSGGSCGTTLAAATTCTIGIVYSPGTGVTSSTGTATITASVAVSGSPVALSGTGVAPVIAASLTPTSHNYGTVARGTTTAGPVQVFTLTNTGNVTLTGITQGALGGTNAADFFVNRLLSTCGPAGGGQLLGQTTLAPGAACVVTVQFRPLTTEATGAKSATISVSDAAGTQTSTLTGTANP